MKRRTFIASIFAAAVAAKLPKPRPEWRSVFLHGAEFRALVLGSAIIFADKFLRRGEVWQIDDYFFAHPATVEALAAA